MDLDEHERHALLGMRAPCILLLNRAYESGEDWSRDREGRFMKLRTLHEAARQEIVQGRACGS